MNQWRNYIFIFLLGVRAKLQVFKNILHMFFFDTLNTTNRLLINFTLKFIILTVL